MSETSADETPLTALPEAPPGVVRDDGTPADGLYRGGVVDGSFTRLRGAWALPLLDRKLAEKRWQYLFVATPDAMVAMALVDAGYLSTGFCAVFDRGARRLLADFNPVLPPLCAWVGEHPGDGALARLTGPGVLARIERSGETIRVAAMWRHVQIDLSLDVGRAPPPISAVAPVGVAGRFDFTQKLVLVPAEGEIRAANVVFPVQGAFAGLDYTHGLLARKTSWRWAFGMGRSGSHLVGFNVSEGFLQGNGENAAWIDGEPHALGPMEIAFDRSAPLGPWTVRGEGGTDLTFSPEGSREQAVDLKVLRSRYVQPFGTFSGRIVAGGVAHAIDGVPGVAEDHDALW